MNRTEMIREIAKQAGCSKRLVRKRLFQLSTRFKKERYYKRYKFNEAFFDKNTDWKDVEKLRKDVKNGVIGNSDFWRIANRFEVAFFPSGCVVLFWVDSFYEDEPDYIDVDSCGARLYNY